MDEQRTNRRRRTLKSGTIIFDREGIVCIIRNLSATGACLQVPSTKGIPGYFTLLIEAEGANRVCRVSWMTETRLGVGFLA
jgi:hypothetical protein